MHTLKCAFFMSKINIFKRVLKKIKEKRTSLKYLPILKKNIDLKDSQKGKRCFIIGNGPSIKDQDLLKLNGEQTFVVNTFWNHPQFKEINPKYYIITDTDVFPKEKSNYWSEELLSKKHIIEESREIKMLLNVLGKETIEKNNIYPQNKKYYIMLDGYFKEDGRFNIQIDKTIPQTKNVVITCLIAAAYMGFEEIYLLGCEHDFLAHPNLYSWKHFYEEGKINIHDKKDQEYFKLAKPSYEAQIDQVKTLFRNYRLLKTKLSIENPKIRIFNATPNSFLDVFPMINFEEIKFNGK